MTKEQWDAMADRLIEKLGGDSPEEIMLRASFEHSKSYDDRPITDEWCLEICAGELRAMLAALATHGYAIVPR